MYGGVLTASLTRENLFLTAEFLKGDELSLWPFSIHKVHRMNAHFGEGNPERSSLKCWEML